MKERQEWRIRSSVTSIRSSAQSVDSRYILLICLPAVCVPNLRRSSVICGVVSGCQVETDTVYLITAKLAKICKTAVDALTSQENSVVVYF